MRVIWKSVINFMSDGRKAGSTCRTRFMQENTMILMSEELRAWGNIVTALTLLAVGLLVLTGVL